MKNFDNDNEPFSFITLSAATRNVTRYLGLDEKKEDSGDERKRSEEAEKRALERLKFVNLRLRELEGFENRARGQRRK